MGHHKEHEGTSQTDYKVGKDNQTSPESAEARTENETRAETETAGSTPFGKDEFARIRLQQEKLMKRLGELRTASQEAWSEIKVGAESAFDELKTSVQKAIARFETAMHVEKETKKSA